MQRILSLPLSLFFYVVLSINGLIIFGLVGMVQASVVTIDFEGGPSGVIVRSASSNGYTLTPATGDLFLTRNSNGCGPNCASNGTINLFAGGFNLTPQTIPPVTLTEDDGLDFILMGFDYAEFIEGVSTNFQNATSLVLTGYLSGGGTIKETLSLDGRNDGPGGRADFQEADLDSSWSTSRLSSLQITGVDKYGDDGGFALDNIQVSTEEEDDDVEQAKQKIFECTDISKWEDLSPCGAEIASTYEKALYGISALSIADAFCQAIVNDDWCGLYAEGLKNASTAIAYYGGGGPVGGAAVGAIESMVTCAADFAGIDINKAICDATLAWLSSTINTAHMLYILTYSPVDISVTDIYGKKLWIDIDGDVHNELNEGSWILTLDDHREIAIIPNPSENYMIEIIGRPEAQSGDTFDLKVFYPINETETLSLTTEPLSLTYENVPVISTTLASTIIGPNISQYDLDIDEDGDGIVDFKVIPKLLNGEPFDSDGDGYGFDTDCDDSNPDINPDKYELPGNNIDENCDAYIACNSDESWKNHGKFVNCVAHETKSLIKQGVLNGKEGGALIKAAAQSDVGKK